MANEKVVEGEQQLEAVVNGDQQAVIGNTKGTHRAGPGEGNRAPSVSEGADHPEFSIFDGTGNESVVALTTDAEGRASEGTGPDSATAMADGHKPGHMLGKDFGPVISE
jgi:hypothetical protein